ncbi:MAG: MFS transporter [Planctomycetota bacterium]
MTRPPRLLVVTFLEEVAGMLVARGVYFFAHDELGFSGVQNLAVALTFGAAYVVGAMISGPVSRRLAEKRMLQCAIVGQALLHVILFVWPIGALLFVGAAGVGLLNGMKWPVIESYVSAGLTPTQTSRAVGRFNMTWATAVPTTMVLTGPLVAFTGRGIFLAGAAVTLLSLVLSRTLALRPRHLPHDHPARPHEGRLRRYRGLLASGRWTMISSYAMQKVLDPLVPGIFAGMGVRTLLAAPLWSIFGWTRLATFATMRRFTGWHGRRGLLLAALAVLPAGFFLILLGPGIVETVTALGGTQCLAASLAAVLGGAMLMGLAAGASYYAALYYAMVVKNASVDAGGAHEGLIGLAFATGPLVGLLGAQLAGLSAGFTLGYLAATGPFVLLCAAGALRSLRRAREGGPDP